MRQTDRRTAIKSWNLFGETGDLPDMVHCERIAARSKLYNWELAPHRHARLHQVLLVETGGGTAFIEGESWRLQPRKLVNVPAGAVHAFSFKPATDGYVVTMAAEMLDEVLREREGLRNMLSRPLALKGGNDIRKVLAEIFIEYAGMRFGRAHVLRSHSSLLVGLVARAIAQTGETAAETAASPLLRKFEALVDEHFIEHWKVNDYAREIGVAAGHLSRVARESVGVSASRFIEARIIREARRLLAFTALPVAEIAYELGFVDPAYFTRVFTRATGYSPRAFRNDLQH